MSRSAARGVSRATAGGAARWAPRAAALLAAALLAAAATALGAGAARAQAAGAEPDALEQEGIWLLNRARHDPAAYGEAIGLDLSAVAPRPPLAPSAELTASARFHASEMLAHDYFAHTSAVTGDGPNQMAVHHGYDLYGAGLGARWGELNTIESLAVGVNLLPDFGSALEALVVDAGVEPPGHRIHLLAMDAGFADDREVGFGRAEEAGRRFYAIHTGHRSPADRFLTGVVYRDLDGDGSYDAGEGLGDVVVQAGRARTRTLSEGGYALAVEPGDHLVTCYGGSFAGRSHARVQVAERSVAVDCIEGAPVAEVDFAFQDGSRPPPLDVAVASSADGGAAPFSGDLLAVGGSPESLFVWDFGDGTGSTGRVASHTWLAPGLHPVTVRALDVAGSGAALHLVAVGGPAGAGPGTMPPTDASLEPTFLAARRDLARPGRDRIELTALLEAPGGFAPEGRRVEVSVLGVTRAFTLDASGRASDAQGNHLELAVDGALPAAAGARARLTVHLEGDLAAALDAAGLLDATYERTLPAAPVALLLEQLPYRGAAPLTVHGHARHRTRAHLTP